MKYWWYFNASLIFQEKILFYSLWNHIFTWYIGTKTNFGSKIVNEKKKERFHQIWKSFQPLFLQIFFILSVLCWVISVAISSSLLIFSSIMSNFPFILSNVFFVSDFISRNLNYVFSLFSQPLLHCFKHVEYNFNVCFNVFISLCANYNIYQFWVSLINLSPYWVIFPSCLHTWQFWFRCQILWILLCLMLGICLFL